MALTILIPLLVCVLGAFVYALSNTKAAQLGLYAFACGLLVTLWHLGGAHVSLP